MISKVYEKKNIKKKNTKTDFEGGYLHYDWADLIDFGMDMCWETFHYKNGAVTFRSYKCMKMAFCLFLYNTHLSVKYSHWLYLAALHTIMCLDFYCFVLLIYNFCLTLFLWNNYTTLLTESFCVSMIYLKSHSQQIANRPSPQ